MTELLVISFYGIIAGLGYSILHIFVEISNHKRFVYILTDIISSIFAGLIFVYCVIFETRGIVRVYTICAFLFGILIEVISVGNLLDFLGKKFYNIISKVNLKINQKRKFKKGENKNDTKPTESTC